MDYQDGKVTIQINYQHITIILPTIPYRHLNSIICDDMVERTNSGKWNINNLLAKVNSYWTTYGLQKYCKVVFRSYLELKDNPTVINNRKTRIHDCIYLGPTQNLKGNYMVFIIYTGRVQNRINIIPMVVPS